MQTLIAETTLHSRFIQQAALSGYNASRNSQATRRAADMVRVSTSNSKF